MVNAAPVLVGLTGWILSTLVHTTSAQQYAGQTIQHQLPGTDGAEIAFWNIKDENGQDTTLINYASVNSQGQRPNNAQIRRAIIVIHGEERNGNEYFNSAIQSLRGANQANGDVNVDNVIIIAPHLTSSEEKNFAFPWTDGLPAGQGSTSNALVFAGNSWSTGARNVYPHNVRSISSFDAFDQMLQYFDDKTRFPNLNQIVVAGHSLGAQTVQRYAVVGKELNLQTPHTYWLGNPNSFVWLDEKRPADVSQCPTFNDWRDGLDKYTNNYERDFVRGGVSFGDVAQRWANRQIIYARGLNDFGNSENNDCGPFAQGQNRGERFLNFLRAFPPDKEDSVDYVENVGHDHQAMIGSEAGRQRIYLDNFTGDNFRKGDMGPRQQDGDNPHPQDGQVSPPTPLPAPPARTTSNPSSTKGGPQPTETLSPEEVKEKRTKTIILGASVGGGVFVFLMSILICLFFCVRRRRDFDKNGVRLYDEEGKRNGVPTLPMSPSPWSSSTTLLNPGAQRMNSRTKIRKIGNFSVARSAMGPHEKIEHMPEKPPVHAQRGVGPPPDPSVWKLIPSDGKLR